MVLAAGCKHVLIAMYTCAPEQVSVLIMAAAVLVLDQYRLQLSATKIYGSLDESHVAWLSLQGWVVTCLQWQEEHQKFLVRRTLSDPSISATTGLPAGLHGTSSVLHNVKTAPVLQRSGFTPQQQGTQQDAGQQAIIQTARQRVHMTAAASAPVGFLDHQDTA